MHQLPPPLAALASHRQFLLWRTVPGANGKPTKLPCDMTGRVVDAHDPQHWMDAATACGMSELQGLGVAFVLTSTDPFFCIDVDHALQGAQWSPLAQQLCAQFAGAAVEVSTSGAGLHIFGRYVTLAPHRSKNIDLGIELYTEQRFIALTGTGAAGDAGTDHTAALAAATAAYWPPRTAADGAPEGWSTEPRADWRGPTSDEDLIRRALASKSAGSVFGHRASFADLWERNEDVLAGAYPDPSGMRTYDGSSADAALAQHLAFWTGCDCARIDRLMRASGLAREKYEREDYLERTVLTAVRMQREVLQDALVAPPEHLATQAPAPAEPVATFLTPADQIAFFQGCTYVSEHHRALVPGGHMLKPDQFKVAYGGRSFVMDAQNARVSKDAWEAFTQNQCYRPPIADTTCFKPTEAPGALLREGSRSLVNTWWPPEVKRVKGDPALFLRHLELLLPVERDRRIVLSYAAACVQYPGVKFQWCPLIQGTEGNGKTVISRCIAEAVGQRYTHWVRADRVTAQFNAWLVNNLFIAVEDIYVPESKRETWEIVKPMITGDRIEVEGKGVDQRTREICCNFLLNSNHKDAVRKTRNDRRLAFFYTPQQTALDALACGMTPAYFARLYDWLKREDGYAIVSEFLATYPIEAEFNPAGACTRAPNTSSTEEAIGASLGSVEHEVLEAIETQAPGFKGGWVSSIQLDALLTRSGYDKRVPRNKRRELMDALGFVWHPALPEGRTLADVLPDGGRPRLYVRLGSPAAMIPSAADVGRAYSAAQLAAAVKA